MVNPSTQLTFPCPECGEFLTLRTLQAAGPCPSCATVLEVHLTVTPRTRLEIGPDSDPNGKKFESRHFRPVGQPPAPRLRSR